MCDNVELRQHHGSEVGVRVCMEAGSRISLCLGCGGDGSAKWGA